MTFTGLFTQGWLGRSRAAQNAKLALWKEGEALRAAMNYDPLTQNSRDYCERYLEVLFEQHGLPASYINKPIDATISDIRPMLGQAVDKMSKQIQPIEYETSWTPLQLTTGMYLKEVYEKAGKMGEFDIHWTSVLPVELRKTMMGDGLWTSYRDFFEEGLNSGPMADDAIVSINAMVTGTLLDSYAEFPEMANNIDTLKQQICPVFYRGTVVAGIFKGPPLDHKSSDTLYSLNDDFPPTPIDGTGRYLLRRPQYQAAVAKGLPLKITIGLGDLLFQPQTKGRDYPRTIDPDFTFGPPGPGDRLWDAYKSKLNLDLDTSTFSSTEQKQMLYLGLTQSGMQGASLMMAPLLPTWMLSFNGVVSTLPDVVAAMAVDNSQESQAHLGKFLRGILAEAVGGLAFAGSKALLNVGISRATVRIIKNPMEKYTEITRLLDLAKNPAVVPRASLMEARNIVHGRSILPFLVTKSGATLEATNSISVIINRFISSLANAPEPEASPKNDTVAASLLTATVSPPLTWDILNAEQKVQLTLADLLVVPKTTASYQNFLDLLNGWDQAIAEIFTSDSQMPTEQFDTLLEPTRKYLATKYALKDQDGNVDRPQALEFANKKYAMQTNQSDFDRIYFYTMEESMRELAKDTVLSRNLLKHPSDTLRKALLLDTPEQINAFLNSLKANELLETTVAEMRNNPSESQAREMSAFSSKQTDLFLESFDEKVLLLPGNLHRLALFHEYLCRMAAGEGWHFSPQSRMETIVANFKRILGAEAAIPPMMVQVLNRLNYNNHASMVLPGFNGQYLDTLCNNDLLNDIPAYSKLDGQQRLAVSKAISAGTGISRDYPLGSLTNSVARVLSQFDTTELAKLNYPGNEITVLNQLIAVDLAANNGVGKIDLEWAKEFWELLADKSKTVSGLAEWLNIVQRKDLDRPRDDIIVAIHELYTMANAEPGKTITQPMIELAIQLKQKFISIPPIDGDSPDTRTWACLNYLTEAMGGPLPVSIQQWKDWLEAQPTNAQIAPDGRSPILPNQLVINAMITRMMDIIDPDRLLVVNQDQTLPPFDLQVDPLAGAKLLALSGFHGIETKIEDVTYPIKVIVNERDATTVFSEMGALYDGYSRAVKEGHPIFNRMLAIDIFRGQLYSGWPINDYPDDPIRLELDGRDLTNDPSIKTAPAILAGLNDYSNHNGTKIFDKHFDINENDIRASKCNPGQFFRRCYDGSWLFRLIVNEVDPVLGKLTCIYGEWPGTDHDENIYMPWDRDLCDIPKEIDLTGTEQDASLERMYLQQWLGKMLNKEDGPGLINWIRNVILQQAGFEELAYDAMASSSTEEQMRDFQYEVWINKFLNAQLKKITPAPFQNATFTSDANAAITVRQLTRLPSLQQPSPTNTLFNAISVEAPGIGIKYQEELDRFVNEQYLKKGLFSQLMSTCTEHISTDNPWRFVYLDQSQKTDILSTYQASHYVDHRAKIAYMGDPESVFFLGPYGLQRLDRKTQTMIVLMEICTGKTYLTTEQMRNNRGADVLLANACLQEDNHKAVPVLVAAMIDDKDKDAGLNLLKNFNLIIRNNDDENEICNKLIKKHPQNV
ncbi:hypothetical protein ACVBEF_11545 [Glaciimonas sp. GG7]